MDRSRTNAINCPQVAPALAACTKRPAAFSAGPFVVHNLMNLFVLGHAFPIYGLPPSDMFRLTVWRASLYPLLCYAVLRGLVFKPLRLPVLRMFLLLLLIRGVSIFYSDEFWLGAKQLTWFSESIAIVVIVVAFSSRPGFMREYVNALRLFGGLAAIVVAFQFFRLSTGEEFVLPFSLSAFGYPEDALPWTYPFFGGRVVGGFFEPNMTGTYCSMLLCMLVPDLVSDKRQRKVNGIVVLACVVAIFASGSRQAAVSSAICTLVSMAMLIKLLRSRIYAIRISVLCVLLFVAAGGSYFVSSNESEHVIERSGRAYQYGDVTGGRAYDIRQVVELLDWKALLLGVGEGGSLHGAHNAPLIVLHENGVFALSVYLAICVLLVLQPLRGFTAEDRAACAPRIAATAIALNWVLLCFFNWSQLSNVTAFPFLAYTVAIISKGHERMGARCAKSSLFEQT